MGEEAHPVPSPPWTLAKGSMDSLKPAVKGPADSLQPDVKGPKESLQPAI